MNTPDGRPQDTHSDPVQDDPSDSDPRYSGPGYSDTDAQRHPKGNVQDRTESPEVGLPVDDGEPSGEQNGEQRETDEREED